MRQRLRSLWKSVVPDVGASLLCGTVSWLLFSGWVSYRCGLSNSMDAQMSYCLAGIVVVAILLAVVAIRFAVHAAAGRRVKGAVCIGLFLGPIVVLAATVAGPMRLEDYSFDRGFRDWAAKEADIPAIRAWMDQVQVDASGKVAESNWPPCVAKLRPQGVHVETEPVSERRVTFWWGGGHVGRRELVIGQPDMEIPGRQTTFGVTAGVYVERWP